MTAQGVGMAGAALAAGFLPVHLVVAGTGVPGTLRVLTAVLHVRATEVRDGADHHVTSG